MKGTKIITYILSSQVYIFCVIVNFIEGVQWQKIVNEKQKDYQTRRH